MTPERETLNVRKVEFTPSELQEGLERLQGRVHRRKTNRTALRAGAIALSCAAAVLVALNLPNVGETAGTKPLETVSNNEEKGLPHGETLRFPDGSGVRLLTDSAQINVIDADEKAPRVELLDGSANFHIVSDETRAFTILSHAIEVTTRGARVSLFPGPSRVRVVVEEGMVEVGSNDEKRELRAGEASWFPPKAEAVANLKSEPESKATPARKDPPPSAVEEFRSHHKRAEYSKAYALVSTGAFVLSNQDLMRAADAARYSGHPTEAIGFLNRVSKGSALGTTAAFTRGRLYLYELGDAGRAASAFSEARKLAGSGPLAEDALFREIESRVRAGQLSRAKKLAAQFRRSYPSSQRSSAVAKLIESK